MLPSPDLTTHTRVDLMLFPIFDEKTEHWVLAFHIHQHLGDHYFDVFSIFAHSYVFSVAHDSVSAATLNPETGIPASMGMLGDGFSSLAK